MNGVTFEKHQQVFLDSFARIEGKLAQVKGYMQTCDVDGLELMLADVQEDVNDLYANIVDNEDYDDWSEEDEDDDADYVE